MKIPVAISEFLTKSQKFVMGIMVMGVMAYALRLSIGIFGSGQLHDTTVINPIRDI